MHVSMCISECVSECRSAVCVCVRVLCVWKFLLKVYTITEEESHCAVLLNLQKTLCWMFCLQSLPQTEMKSESSSLFFEKKTHEIKIVYVSLTEWAEGQRVLQRENTISRLKSTHLGWSSAPSCLSLW